MDKRIILFPTDFSERASKALDETIGFTLKFDHKIIIYHVYHRPIIDGGTHSELKKLLNKLEKQIDQAFEKLLENHWKLRKVNYEFRKELGISIDNIRTIAEKEKVDLIITATKGAKGFGELWGTKTARIIQNVHVPVLVMPDNSTLGDLRKIGLACDYSEKTDYQTLHFLVEVAEGLKADIDVITLNRHEKTLTDQQKNYRNLVHNELNGIPISFNFTFNSNIEEGVIDYCTSNGIDLITILPKTYNFIERLFHESLTKKMTFHSPVPLLVLK